MESSSAIQSLSALAQEGRLAIFRLLVGAGSEGIAAGEIARRLGVPANTLSAQLNVLAHAGLVSAERAGRSVIYRAEIGAMSALVLFLMQDCCGGRPEICVPVTAGLADAERVPCAC